MHMCVVRCEEVCACVCVCVYYEAKGCVCLQFTVISGRA